MRLAVAAVSGLVALKVADLGVGAVLRSHERHLLRLTPRATLRHKGREFDYEFRTNALGFRGPDVPFDKPEGTFRIVVLGDSFVAGYGVADEHVLTVELQERLKSEVVNVGRVGTSTIRELDLYETFGRRFHPDVVILAYFLGNDLAEVVQEQTRAEVARWRPAGTIRRTGYLFCPNLYLELARYKQSQRQLRDFTPRSDAEVADDIRAEAIARGRDPGAAAELYQSLSDTIRGEVAAGLLSEQRVIDSCVEPDRLVRSLDPDDVTFDHAWQRTRSHLDLLEQAVRQDGATLVLVAIPAPVQVDRRSLEFHRELGYVVREDWLGERQPRAAKALEDWANSAGVAYLDLTDVLRESDEPLYFIEDVHFNPAGNARAAEEIAAFLRGRGLDRR